MTGAEASSNPDHKQATSHQHKAVKAEVGKHRVVTNPPHRNAAIKAEIPKKAAAISRRDKKAKADKHKHEPPAEVKRAERAPGPRVILSSDPANVGNSTPAPPQLPPVLAALKQALHLVQQHKFDEVTTLATSIDDPVAQKLVEWAYLHDPESRAGFDRYNAFLQNNPAWSSTLLRRRAEARLWQERRDAATVRRFVGEQPVSTQGRLAIARLLLETDRLGAANQVRAIWQSADLSAELEGAIASTFPGALTADDDIVRMDRRIGAKDFAAAMRAANRLGSAQAAIVKACEAAEANSTKAKTVLASVPEAARTDLGYALCRLHWLLGQNDLPAAVALVAEVSSSNFQHQDTNEWWRERRMLARRLIDVGDAKTAYRVVRDAAPPANPYYRAEFHFMAGWIALRFMSDPIGALRHFAKIDEGSSDPIVLARAAYWRGRAFEAADQFNEMQVQYERAAQYPTAYYGQLARARLGLRDNALPPPPEVANTNSELLRAVEMLYEVGELDLVLTFINDFAETSSDIATLDALGQLTAHYHDAQAMLILGKTALARGLAMERYAFPVIGVPAYSSIGPAIDPCMVYSVARVESAFDQRDTSPANAVGLMQVTPEAGRDTAKRFGVAYDWDRLVSDPVYNTQMGVAEISALFKEYAGSYVMTFAGYNAGRGRVRQWVAEHGDPRDPKVDAVDWVERIPLAETRNYVQRVMESLQVYAARLGASIATAEPNLHRVLHPKPTYVDAVPH